MGEHKAYRLCTSGVDRYARSVYSGLMMNMDTTTRTDQLDAEIEAAYQRRLNSFPEGCKVCLKTDIERYPHFIADAGMTGIVAENSKWLFAVRMDMLLVGAEEWDNEVCWADYELDGKILDDHLERLCNVK
jgi:hypothetical protein